MYACTYCLKCNNTSQECHEAHRGDPDPPELRVEHDCCSAAYCRLSKAQVCFLDLDYHMIINYHVMTNMTMTTTDIIPVSRVLAEMEGTTT